MTSEEKRQYRDGGYGWVVVISAFFVSFLTDGIPYSFGVLLVDMVNLFQTDRGQTAIAGALIRGLMHIIGPVAGALCESYGYRVVVVSGAIVSSAGLLASAFVSQLPLLYITYGIFCGTGFGLMYLPTLVCVIHNFNERRGLANGIAVCGSGVGMFVFNVLTRYLLDTYGLSGTFLILSGICLNGVVSGLLLSDPEQVHEEAERELNGSSQTITQVTSFQIEIDGSRQRYTNSGFSRTYMDANTDSNTCDTDLRHTYNDGTRDVPEIQMNQDAESDNNFTSSEEITTSNADQVDDNKTKDVLAICARLRKTLIAMWDLSLLKNLKFLTYIISIFLLYFAFIIPIHLLPDEAKSLHMSKQDGSMLLSAMGISNTIGRIIVGWLGDRKVVNRFVIFVGLIVCSGIFTCLSPLLTTFEAKMTYACTYGLFIGGVVSLYTVVLADIVGLGNLSRAFGLVMFVIGVSSAIGTALGGWLFDVTGSYDVTFVMAGILFLLSAVVITIPQIRKCCCSRRQKA